MEKKSKLERVLTDDAILTDWFVGGLLIVFGSQFWTIVGLVVLFLGIRRAIFK